MFTVNIGNMRGFKPDISQCAGGKDGCVKGAGMTRSQVIKKHNKTRLWPITITDWHPALSNIADRTVWADAS